MPLPDGRMVEPFQSLTCLRPKVFVAIVFVLGAEGIPRKFHERTRQNAKEKLHIVEVLPFPVPLASDHETLLRATVGTVASLLLDIYSD